MHARDKQKKTPGADVLSSKKKLQKSDRPAEGGVQTPPPPLLYVRAINSYSITRHFFSS